MANNWSKDSWRNKPVVQVPEYDDQKALEKVEKRLSSYPPLVFAGEARRLKENPKMAGYIIKNLFLSIFRIK